MYKQKKLSTTMGPKWPKMVQNNTKWSKVLLSGPKWFVKFRRSKTVQNAKKRWNFLKNCQKWLKMVQNNFKRSKIIRTFSELVKMVKKKKCHKIKMFQKLSKIFHKRPNWSQVVQNSQKLTNMVEKIFKNIKIVKNVHTCPKWS